MKMKRAFQDKLQDDLAIVKGRRSDIDAMRANLDGYIRWHREHPELAAPLVMFIHKEVLEEGSE